MRLQTAGAKLRCWIRQTKIEKFRRGPRPEADYEYYCLNGGYKEGLVSAIIACLDIAYKYVNF